MISFVIIIVTPSKTARDATSSQTFGSYFAGIVTIMDKGRTLVVGCPYIVIISIVAIIFAVSGVGLACNSTDIASSDYLTCINAFANGRTVLIPTNATRAASGNARHVQTSSNWWCIIHILKDVVMNEPRDTASSTSTNFSKISTVQNYSFFDYIGRKAASVCTTGSWFDGAIVLAVLKRTSTQFSCDCCRISWSRCNCTINRQIFHRAGAGCNHGSTVGSTRCNI